jgi:hypothetical protein
MRFRLRTLLILLAVLPPLSAGAWFGARAAIVEYQYRRALYYYELGCGPNRLKPGVSDPKPTRSEMYRRLRLT